MPTAQALAHLERPCRGIIAMPTAQALAHLERPCRGIIAMPRAQTLAHLEQLLPQNRFYANSSDPGTSGTALPRNPVAMPISQTRAYLERPCHGIIALPTA
ncbi:hypothetical protein KIL84_008531 [Mauremys mutica]|nr:hypothetical protein KIL84_008531 [Mauremys mutica]